MCWTTPTTGTATAPATVDPKKLLTETEDFITESTVSWSAIANLWVSPKFRYQDGWWEENSAGKFVETDKKADTRCYVNRQCKDIANGCCMEWPDKNNTRCKDSALAGKSQTQGLVTFTPTCRVDATPSPGGTTVKPENAKQDLAAGALAAAKENLGKFYDNILKDKKTAEGYATMDAAAKAKFDKEQTATKAKREALWTELRKAAKADQATCGDDCKAIFEADLLKWGKAVYETCKADAKSIECREAEKIKKAEEKARAAGTKNYYLMTPTEREAFTTARKGEVAKEKSSLAAAWLKSNVPAAGKDGSSCAGTTKCTGATLCCGSSKPKAADVPKGATTLAKVCVTSKDKKTGTWKNDFGWNYDHTCDLANNLMVSGAALATAAFALM